MLIETSGPGMYADGQVKCMGNAHPSAQVPTNHIGWIVWNRPALLVLWVVAGIAAYFLGALPGGAAQGQQAARPTIPTRKPDANLLQLMRGVMYAQANVIFAGQMDVSTIPHDDLPAVSPNPLTSVYGGWQAVENSALGLAESASMLLVPGRTCANGIDVPVKDSAWMKYAKGMHDAALVAYKAAQSKNTDEMVEATTVVSDSCAACHNVYRSNRTGFAARCTATPATTP